jgi:hypothetical protein
MENTYKQKLGKMSQIELNEELMKIEFAINSFENPDILNVNNYDDKMSVLKECKNFVKERLKQL